jgi:hypothetical protein
MPQPYPKHLFPNVKADSEAIAQSRPECVLNGMAAIAQHSMAESMVSNVLVSMLDANPGPAAAIYGAIRNGKLQREALLAAAGESLSSENQALFGKVLRLLEASARGRDQLAHSIWATDEQFPQGIIMIVPDQMWRFSLQEKVLNAKGGPELTEASQLQQSIRDACTVWSVQDLADVRARGVRAFSGLIAFDLLLKSTDDEAAGEHRKTIETILTQV